MLVDINLIPEKQKKSFMFLFLALMLVLLAVAGAAYLYVYYGQTKQQLEILQTQIDDTKLLRTLQEKKIEDYTTSTAVEELHHAITWTEELPISTVALIRHLSGLLPERGFVLNFNYTDTGPVHITVQFDTSTEAAYYLKSLKDSPFIERVDLASLVTSPSEDNPDTKGLTSFLLPRYIAQFNLQVNKAALKDSEKGESEQ